MGAALSGTMRSVIQKSAEFATQRVQFGGRIDGYGAIQEKIARSAKSIFNNFVNIIRSDNVLPPPSMLRFGQGFSYT